MPGLHTNIGAKRARQARETLGLDEVSPVVCVLALVEERAGLPVIVGAMPKNLAGALWRNGTRAIIWVNGGQSVERQRFTVAHEFGHDRCEHTGTPVDTFETLYGGTHDPQEVQANAFAAELPAPRAGVAAMLDGDPSLEDIVRLAAHFGISTIAALYRCNTLGLVSPARSDVLKREIDEKLHHAVWDYLDLEPLTDALAQLEERPRIPASLAGSALAAVLRGEASVGAAAASAHCPAGLLADAAAALSR